MAIEDSDLTARQPKMFYAHPAVWNAANAQLVNSRYELYADRAAAVTITLPAQAPQVLDRLMARVKVDAGVVRTADQQGMGLHVDQDCIMVATAIIGAPPRAQERETVAAGGTATSRTNGEYQTAAAMLAWARSRSAKKWPTTWWELATQGANHRAARLALVEFQKALGGGAGMQAIAQQYALLRQNNPGLADQAIAALGLNTHVAPNVGEAYESFQLGLPNNFMAGQGPDFEADPTGATMAELTTQPGGGGAPVRHGWGQHIGAVVAISAGNRITLENYARSHELGQMRQGSDHYFQMYGPPHLPNQTWHHAWTAGAVAAGLPPVKNAVTILVRR